MGSEKNLADKTQWNLPSWIKPDSDDATKTDQTDKKHKQTRNMRMEDKGAGGQGNTNIKRCICGAEEMSLRKFNCAGDAVAQMAGEGKNSETEKHTLCTHRVCGLCKRFSPFKIYVKVQLNLWQISQFNFSHKPKPQNRIRAANGWRYPLVGGTR